jgi:hypothetical protein
LREGFTPAVAVFVIAHVPQILPQRRNGNATAGGAAAGQDI